MENEKRNHSNDPSSKQPIDELGRYASKPSSNGEGEKGGVGDTSPILSNVSNSDGLDIDLSELEGIEEFLDLSELEGIDEFLDSDEAEDQRLQMDYNGLDFMGLSQQEAKKKADEISKRLNEDKNSWISASVKFDRGFKDQRIRLACLVAADKVLKDFPQLKEIFDERVELTTGYGKSNGFVTWGQANASYGFQLLSYGFGGLKVMPFKNLNVQIFSHSKYEAPRSSSAESFTNHFNKSKDHDHFENSEAVLMNTMFHELGHIVSYALISRDEMPYTAYDKKDARKKLWLKTKEQKDNIINVGVRLQQGKDAKFFSQDTSGYGKTNSAEWFAETFASMYSPTPRASALAMREYLKEVLK